MCSSVAILACHSLVTIFAVEQHVAARVTIRRRRCDDTSHADRVDLRALREFKRSSDAFRLIAPAEQQQN